MATDIEKVRALLELAGLDIADERLQPLADALNAAIEVAESIRAEPTPMPEPSSFDPAWSTKA